MQIVGHNVLELYQNKLSYLIVTVSKILLMIFKTTPQYLLPIFDKKE